MSITDLQRQAKLSFDHALAKKNLRERMQSRLTVTHNGGVFIVEPQLFVLLDLQDAHEMVILDSYDTPILVNADELRTIAKQRYHELMNEWLHEWDKLKTVRRAQDV